MSSIDDRVAHRIAALREDYRGSVFCILDSDHSEKHVLAEMNMLRPLLCAGDYLVVEDSNINGHPVNPLWGNGPFEAIAHYFRVYPNDYRHRFSARSEVRIYVRAQWVLNSALTIMFGAKIASPDAAKTPKTTRRE